MSQIDLNTLVGIYIPQLLALLLVWGSIALLAVKGLPIPDPLLDAGFAILGFYFHSVISQVASRGNANN
jgi:hypothetical protein